MTDKNYPIKKIWILKQVISRLSLFHLFIIIIMLPIIMMPFVDNNYKTNSSFSVYLITIFFIYLIILMIPSTLTMIIFYFIRKNFRYEMAEKFISLEQGIINKQKRYIPYSVIQNVSVNYDLIDKFLGLANLTIENASLAGGIVETETSKINNLGFSGNRVNILGLDPKNAEELKLFILKKIKENPANQNSGL